MSEQTQKPMLLNRRQRRHMLRERGIMKIISKLGFFHPTRVQLREQNMENGRKLHQQHVDANEARRATQLEAALETAKSVWKDSGYNQEEMLLLEEAWAIGAVKNKETYREDKKNAKLLRKQALELRDKRK